MNTNALNDSVAYIKSWLQFRYDREEIPGFVVAIAHKGELLMNEAYGYADVDKNTKLTPGHIFRIASHSKTFTATALMQLHEQGKLRIDDYAATYLPWLSNHSDSRWQKVTLRQLMSHGAGVIRDGLDSDYWQLERPFPDKNELQKEILEANLVIDANTKLKYSNFGYSLLGLVIENVSGEQYTDYVINHIVTPLGLEDTGPEYSTAIDSKIATGYTRRDINKTRLPIAAIDTRAMASATGFYSTAKDLATYFAAHFAGSGKLLDDESKKEMQRIQWHAYTPGQGNHEDYGLGIEIEHLGKRAAISHGGGFPGYITKSIADPKDDLVVVVLTNCIDGPAGTIAKSIYGIIDYYQSNTPAAPAKHDMKNLEGRYINLWGTTDIVVTGDKVVAASPESWRPFANPEELEYVDDTTLKVVDTSSFYSDGELVHFNIVDGKVESVNYSGSTTWPEQAWLSKQSGKTIVAVHHDTTSREQ